MFVYELDKPEIMKIARQKYEDYSIVLEKIPGFILKIL